MPNEVTISLISCKNNRLTSEIILDGGKPIKMENETDKNEFD